MAEATIEPGAPNLNLTPEEKRVYGQLFRQADSDNVGVVTGEVAVKFFERTKLDSRILGEIWQIADKENRGFLTPAGFGIALRLIGHAQNGREPLPELAFQPGPLPRFEGFTPTPPPPAPGALQAQPTGAPGPIRIPPLTPEKVAQYAALFERQNLQGNMLSGEEAKKIFEKSGLPNDILGRIWMLVDSEQRGALVQTEFIIAMHLLTSMKTGALRGLPNILPAALYEAATRRPSIGASIPRQQSPTTATPPIPAIPRQLSGQAPLQQMRTGSPLGRPPTMSAQSTGGDWLITPADKARFDQLFDELDKGRKGFISGEEAVPFFSQSNLSEDVLAQIWDLADMTSAGRLTRDEFAVAMYLIRQQRSKAGVPLPTTLPPNLIPPSMRAQVRPATATSAFDVPPKPQPKPPSAMDDLMSILDDPQPAAPAPTQVPTTTGGSTATDPFATSVSPPVPSSPTRTSPATSSTTFKPFVPTSSFGRSLTAQATGGSNASSAAKPAATEDDLLGDADPEVNKQTTNETMELANLSNQIGSLTKQVQDVQAQRTAIQNELSQASIQKKNFEQRLAQLRSLYEKEAADVRTLESQLTTVKNENKKLQAECAMIDASYQELQNQHRQLLTALQADQQENANLKEKIKLVNAEIAQLKPQIEKLKSEARQQKGLVAINKKQLATSEGERDKLKNEVDELTRTNEELSRQISASSSPAPAQVSSPALSTASVNNPFFRRTGSTDITSPSAPQLRPFTDKSFDDIFGSSSVPNPVPAQNTGTSTGSNGFATPSSGSPNVSRQPTGAEVPATSAEAPKSTSAFSSLPADNAESLSTSRQAPPLSRTDTSPDGPSLAPPAQIEPAQSEPARPSTAATSATENKPATFSSPSSPDNKETDPFALAEQERKAKEDFESAFASFKKARAANNPAVSFAQFNAEFPPISELERDESDSESERGGFDDDFAPPSPPKAPQQSSTGSRSASPTLTKSTPDATASAGAEQAGASDKPSSSAVSSTNLNNLNSSHVNDIFGSAATTSAPATTQVTSSNTSRPATANTSSKANAFDDLDDDFEGLEDAKEGSADDDFANISRSGFDDFNPVFDSSPPPSQPKPDSSHSAFDSFDFGSLSSASGAAPGSSQQSQPKEQHDWDAIFAGLENAASASQNLASTVTTGADAGSSAPKESAAATTGGDNSKTDAGAPAGPSSLSARPDTPVRRAFSDDGDNGENDHPDVKKLTNMGWSRKDSIAALERNDYNMERVSQTYYGISKGSTSSSRSRESGSNRRVWG